MKKHYIPDGCDQQGRYPERAEPAEACTDIGVEDPPQQDIVRVVLGDLVIAVMLLAVVVTVVLGLLEMAP